MVETQRNNQKQGDGQRSRTLTKLTVVYQSYGLLKSNYIIPKL